MRPLFFRLLLCFFTGTLLLTGPACSRKTGCPANQEAHVKPNRNGQLPTGGGKSNLFPKDMRKKMKGR